MNGKRSMELLSIKKPRMLFVFCLFLAVFSLLYDYAEKTIFRDSTGWAAHGISVLVTCFAGTLAAYFLLRRSERINQQLARSLQELEEIKNILQTKEEMYRSLVESTGDSIYVVDRSTGYLFMNQKHRERMGLIADDYQGQNYDRYHSADESIDFRKQVDAVLQIGESLQFDHKGQGDNKYFLRTFNPIRNAEGLVTAVTVVSTEITRQKELEKSLRLISITDSLTGLYNRRGLFALAEQQIKLVNRSKQWLSVLYADLDNLKEINDQFGHQEGDAALTRAADILRTTYRESDIIARIGGDEFVVIIVSDERRSSQAIHGRLQQNLDAHNEGTRAAYILSLSTGIAMYDPQHPVSFEDLLREADRFMYLHKKKDT
jgi:diguanylate cyclase (GGDEF)-like protein/PAS domain S-box-containing protein